MTSIEMEAYLNLPEDFAQPARPVHGSPSSVSPGGLIRMLGFSTAGGEPGEPVYALAQIQCHSPVHLRLLVGDTPYSTSIRAIPGEPHTYVLTTHLPPYVTFRGAAHLFGTFPLAVEAVGDNGRVVDALTFGEFAYRQPVHNLPTPPPSAPPVPSRTFAPPAPPLTVQLPPAPAPAPVPAPAAAARWRGKLPVLSFARPLDAACEGWSPAEELAQRRLVRFCSRPRGAGMGIEVLAEPISQSVYNMEALAEEEGDEHGRVVVSCLALDAAAGEGDGATVHWITSVDVIRLLEAFTDESFEIDEKNRIRRNLCGFVQTTIGKQRDGAVQALFLRISTYPEPRPLNIEKDVKVFRWRDLGPALEKVVARKLTSRASQSPPYSPSNL